MNWGLSIGMKLLAVLPLAIQSVENFIGKKGKEKQDAAVGLVGTMLAAAEGVTGKDLLDDEAVQAATRSVIDTAVNLQNVIADAIRRRQAAQPQS